MKAVFIILLFAIASHAEENCKKRDLTSKEITQINSCLDNVTSQSSKKSLRLFYDSTGNLYGVETGKDNVVVYTSEGSVNSKGQKLGCNTDRSSNIKTVLSEMVRDEDVKRTSKQASHELDGIRNGNYGIVAGLEKCREMVPYIKCIKDGLYEDLSNILRRMQSTQLKDSGQPSVIIPKGSR